MLSPESYDFRIVSTIAGFILFYGALLDKILRLAPEGRREEEQSGTPKDDGRNALKPKVINLFLGDRPYPHRKGRDGPKCESSRKEN